MRVTIKWEGTEESGEVSSNVPNLPALLRLFKLAGMGMTFCGLESRSLDVIDDDGVVMSSSDDYVY